ncbi:MAG: family 78 glycoside hydrolase catalytic domain [Lachnospiraceae bacterium]|nr:family 78 glycoside hydrolase catalytic domain [Lachnospiraceae bacterium]
MKAVHLQAEYLTEPLGLGNPEPRFYWNCEGGRTQTAYQIVCRRGNEAVWDSGKVESSSMTHIRYAGSHLKSRDRITWSVQLWDEKNEPGEVSESHFELGLLDRSDWKAKWIAGGCRPGKNTRFPVDCFRKEFSAEREIVKARLYATARGVYDVTVNGHKLDGFILAPGITDYRRRIQYQTYDVTALLTERNTLELRLGDGWFRGSSAAYGVTGVYGTQTSLLAQLEITYTDGRTETICTDRSWDWSNDGPIRFADLKDGEVYDASLQPSYCQAAREVPAPENAALTASDNVPVTEHERFRARLLTAGDGTKVLDFGQNIAGYPEFFIKGQKGQRLRLICGEVLDKDGHVDLSGIQESRPAKGWSRMSLIRKLMTGRISGENDPTPRQEIVFTCSGGKDHYKTSFAVFGFRYAQVVGDVAVVPEDFTAVAVYSDLEQTGEFVCSDERVNQLLKNTRWSMKGNFLDVPTDCPTRERLGWTGDAQIFFDTGAYLMNTAPFFGKWLRDMEDAQYKNGLIPAVLPYEGVEMMYKATGSSVGWADAVYLIPYRYYRRFGDKEILRQYWPMMKKYADHLRANLGMKSKKEARHNPDNAFTYEKGVHLGEWLEPEEFRDAVYGTKAKHPEECTAYLYLAMSTIAEIAREIGEQDYAAMLQRYALGARKAYLRFAELDTDRQAKLVRPLALGLLDAETKAKAQKRLKQAVENYNFRVGTGFLSTPFVLPVLTEAGEAETAYKMLLNTEKPGWLAEIKEGATTVWESWEGNLSQNHYSPGAVCQWLFDTAAGIRVDGENHFVIAPVPGGYLTHIEADYKSLYGEVKSRWEKTDSGIRFRFEIPANCTADIRLPDGRTEKVSAGRYEYEV